MKKIIYLFLLLLIFKNEIRAQLKYIDIGDSSFITRDTCVIFKTFDYYRPDFDLKSKLPKGRYIVYEKDRKRRKHIKLYGGYSEDSLKNGTFMYYETFEINKKKESLAQVVYNFRNGKLDGSFNVYGVFNILYSGNYNMGLKHGIFKVYSFGELHYLDYESIYSNDTLLKTIIYFREINKVISEIIDYKNKGLVEQITYFTENGLKKVSYKTNENNTFLKTKFNEKGEIVSTETVNRIEEKQLQQR